MFSLQPDVDQSQPFEPSEFMSPAGGLIVYRTTQQNSCLCSAVNRPLLKAINHTSKQVVIFRPRCKSWRCPGCAAINAQKVVLRAVNGSELLQSRGAVIDFVTVTSHEKLDAAASLAVLPKAWNKLNVRIKRASQEHQYLAIPEQHADGRWHLHAMTTARLPKKWWKDNARSCGLGYQSDVQEVKSLGGVAYYVSKYVSKTLENSNLPKNFRRMRVSRGWPDLPPIKPLEGWEFTLLGMEVPEAHEIARNKRLGFTVILADEKSSWDWIEHFGEGFSETENTP